MLVKWYFWSERGLKDTLEFRPTNSIFFFRIGSLTNGHPKLFITKVVSYLFLSNFGAKIWKYALNKYYQPKKLPLFWAQLKIGWIYQLYFYIFFKVTSNFARKKNWLQIWKSQRILVSLSGNSTFRITSKLKIDFGSPIFWVDKKIEGITIWTLTYLYIGDNSYTKSNLIYPKVASRSTSQLVTPHVTNWI